MLNAGWEVQGPGVSLSCGFVLGCCSSVLGIVRFYNEVSGSMPTTSRKPGPPCRDPWASGSACPF